MKHTYKLFLLLSFLIQTKTAFPMNKCILKKIIGPFCKNITDIQEFSATKNAIRKLKTKSLKNKNSKLKTYFLLKTDFNKITNGRFTSIYDVENKKTDGGELIIINANNGNKKYSISGSKITKLILKNIFILLLHKDQLSYDNIFDQKFTCKEENGKLYIFTEPPIIKNKLKLDTIKEKVNYVSAPSIEIYKKKYIKANQDYTYKLKEKFNKNTTVKVSIDKKTIYLCHKKCVYIYYNPAYYPNSEELFFNKIKKNNRYNLKITCL